MKSIDATIQVEFLELDLSSFQSILDAVHNLLKEESKIDILICNAGMIEKEQTVTENGIEMQFQVNYLGMCSPSLD